MRDAPDFAAPPGSEEGCRSLGSLARAGALPPLATEAHLHARARFLDALDARRGRADAPQGSAWWAMLRPAAVAFACAMGALMLWSALADRRLSYVVEGDNRGTGGVVRAADSEVRVLFSEGSVLRVEPGGSAELAEVTAEGARIVAGGGTLHARIEHLPDTGWSFEAGPYTVRVTGTEFSLTWSAQERRLVVELETGSLLVSGPEAPAGVALHAGRRLVAEEGAGKLSVSDLDDRNAGESGAGVAATDVLAAPDPSEPTEALSSSASASADAAPSSWPELVAAGRYAQVVEQAESEGIDAALATRPLGDLLALGDAARYVKRADLAEKVLAAERTRFPTSPQATTAAFLLGRLAEARGSAGEALQWYQRYLLEAPSGALAEEALGRLMVLLAQSGSREAARATATQYLRRFPAGASAEAAKDLVNEEIEF